MNFKKLAKGAEQKGVQMLATGDCLHPKWLAEIKEMEEITEGTYLIGNTRFVLTTEVEAEKRVHHLLLFPSISSVESFRESVSRYSNNLETDGRPRLKMTGEEIGQAAVDTGVVIGPAHAFTPWTGIYAHFDTLKECYGDLSGKIRYLELGLSANSDYGDRIKELRDVSFLTNSDAHSPQPVRLAREFNTIEARDMTYEEVLMALERRKDRKIVLNVGLPPEEGKYNRTACTRCYKQYELNQVLAMRWRCICHGTIKKGVRDRAFELGGAEVQHPAHRPKYQYMIPLSEIVMRAIGHSSPFTGKVRAIWESLINKFGNEIQLLLQTPTADIEKIAGTTVSDAIGAFREGKVKVIPGGGGQYGTVVLPGQEIEIEDTLPKDSKGQKTLFEYQ
jgi:uncharacterized protein (TIGR00375 family)